MIIRYPVNRHSSHPFDAEVLRQEAMTMEMMMTMTIVEMDTARQDFRRDGHLDRVLPKIPTTSLEQQRLRLE
jgi:hypothetical protein